MYIATFVLSEPSASEFVRIQPIGAEQSASLSGNDYPATDALDNRVDTFSASLPIGSDLWIKFTLEEVRCVHQVMVYLYIDVEGFVYHTTTFTCDQDGCTCDGESCEMQSLEVTGAVGGSSNCKNGDTLMLSSTVAGLNSHIIISEIAVYATRRKKNLRFNL